MGAFFTTIQIKIPCPVQSEQFRNMLCKYYEKKGLVPAAEEDAEFSCWVAVSETGKWATLGCGGYDLGSVYSDVPEIAKALNTHCILTNIIDSDVLCLELFGPTDGQRDTISIGLVDNEGRMDYGLTFSTGNQRLWEPLLAAGESWEQFTAICNTRHTFMEDALYDLAPLFGMDSGNVTYSYNCSEEVPSNEPNVITLYLKKEQKPSGKIIDFAQYRKNVQQLPDNN